ncbi:MAG: hypothetical protein SO013_06040 [Prevotella sp.]|nr:hypothetical protein [Prevotella sp.]
MKKEQKRKTQLQQRVLNESLAFQTMFGARQKLGTLTPKIETRLHEELVIFTNLGIAKYLMVLKDVMDKVKLQRGYVPEPCKGILASSYVAYCLGIDSTHPMEKDNKLTAKDFLSS